MAKTPVTAPLVKKAINEEHDHEFTPNLSQEDIARYKSEVSKHWEGYQN